MPCYEMRTVSVEFKAENHTLLKAAIKGVAGMDMVQDSDGEIWLSVDGYYGAIKLSMDAGQAQVQTGFQDKLNELKRSYSKECVKAATKKVQWAVKFNGQKATINKVQW